MAGAMVISEWHVSSQPNSQGEYIAIRGRGPGLISWIFSLLGVERGVRMVATPNHVRFQEGDLGGSASRIIHLDKICSTYYGYKKPWVEAFIMVVVLAGPLVSIFGGIFGMMMKSNGGLSPSTGGFVIGTLIGLLAAVACGALYYALNKRMTIGLVEMSGVVNQIVFKRSVLEGIKLDEQSSAKASDILQWLMDSARTGSSAPSMSTTQQGPI